MGTRRLVLRHSKRHPTVKTYYQKTVFANLLASPLFFTILLKIRKNCFSKRKLLLGLFLCFTTSIFASQRLSVKASIPTGNSAYPFGILQYQWFKPYIFNADDSFYFDFDTEAAYVKYYQNLPRLKQFFWAVDLKGHAFDWQNLQNIIDNKNGNRQDELSSNAAAIIGGLFLGMNLQALKIQSFIQIEQIFIRAASETSAEKTQARYANWGLDLGFYEVYEYLPFVQLGSRFNFRVMSTHTLRQYNYTLNQSLIAGSTHEIYSAEILFFESLKTESHIFQLQFSGNISSLLGRNQPVDLFRYYSVGAPEYRFRRIAGFAFSEFRVPAFGLLNLDWYWHVHDKLYLWTVWDTAILALQNEQSVETGFGTGLFYSLTHEQNYKSAIFLRTDFALTALRAKELDKLQIFFGYNAGW